MLNSVDNLSMIIFTMLSLVAVLVLAYFLMRWLSRRMNVNSGVSRKIKIIDRAALAPDKCLFVVRVAEKTILVGMSPNSVSKLCDIDDPDGVLDECEAAQESFASILRGSISKRRHPENDGGQDDG